MWTTVTTHSRLYRVNEHVIVFPVRSHGLNSGKPPKTFDQVIVIFVRYTDSMRKYLFSCGLMRQNVGLLCCNWRTNWIRSKVFVMILKCENDGFKCQQTLNWFFKLINYLFVKEVIDCYEIMLSLVFASNVVVLNGTELFSRMNRQVFILSCECTGFHINEGQVCLYAAILTVIVVAFTPGRDTGFEPRKDPDK